MRRKDFFKIALLLILALSLQRCDKPLSVSPPMTPVPVGYIYISSNPEGALIYEDGRNSGMVTPASLPWLEERTYIFTLKKKLYRDTSFSVTVENGDSHYVFIDYFKNPLMRGTIYCNTNADSSLIYFNDSLLSHKTPYKIKGIVPGYYEIKYEREGFRSDSITVAVESGKTADASLMLRDTTVWVDYTVATSGLPDNAITDVAVDSDNVKWIGTNSSGLVAFDGKNWTVYNSSNSALPNDNITTILVDKQNRVWVGTLNGLALIENGSWQVFNSESGAPFRSDYVTVLDAEDDGTLWVGTDYGLLRKKESAWRYYQPGKDGLPHRWVSGLAHDNFGNIWVGSKGLGLAVLHPDGTWTKYINKFDVKGFLYADIPSATVSAIAAEGNVVWIGFYPDPNTKEGGLVKFHNNSWYSSYSPLPSNVIASIDLHVEKDGRTRKWVSTNQGVVTFVTWGNRREYRLANTPLSNENIKGIAYDKNTGIIWVATYGGGLYKFKSNY